MLKRIMMIWEGLDPLNPWGSPFDEYIGLMLDSVKIYESLLGCKELKITHLLTFADSTACRKKLVNTNCLHKFAYTVHELFRA